MATLIGLCIRVKLLRSLPSRFKVRRGRAASGQPSKTFTASLVQVRVRVTPGTHITEDSSACAFWAQQPAPGRHPTPPPRPPCAVNKQLGDKERVAAALENGHLLEVVNKCVAGSDHVAATPGPDAAATPEATEMRRGGPLRQI